MESVGLDSPPADQPLQYLFRVRYAGPSGSGSLKLVLRMLAQDDFRLATSDLLGRSLWTLEYRANGTLFLDHRQQAYCSTTEEIRLREITLETFSLVSIPRLLRGELPIDLGSGTFTGDSTEYLDDQGRRWSVRTEGTELTAWTLWVGEDPTLWWTRQDKGGILSHRDGSQFRWREVVREVAISDLTPLEPPASFRQVSCHESDLPEFRQDQSPPAGEGPS